MSDPRRSAGRREAYAVAFVGGAFLIVAALIQGPGTEWFKSNSIQSSPNPAQSPSNSIQSPPNLVQTPSNPGQAQQIFEDSDAGRPRASASEGSAALQDGESERSTATPSGPHIGVMYGYQFELNTCEAASRLVTCRVTITNLQGDRRLTIGGFSYLSTRAEAIRSVAYTADGTEHFAAEASLGSRAERGAVTSLMVASQPIAGTVVFDDIPTSTSAFTNIRIAFGSDRREFLVPFASVRIR